MASDQKKLVEELKKDWKKLWNERIDDKVRAEGVADSDYSKLFVEKGTVIHATRDYKALDFKDILKQNQIKAEKYVPPTPQVGGWGKFVKTQIRNQPPKRENPQQTPAPQTGKNQPKKGGRGWLHK
jgi:hypothetical protein